MLSTSACSAPLVWFGLQKIPHLSGLSSQPRHWTPVLFPRGVVHESTSLRPFAPGPLRPFFATTNALTPARLYSVQVSLLHVTWPSRPSVSNHPSILRDRFRTLPLNSTDLPLSRVWTSPFTRRLVGCTGRIEFLNVRMSGSSSVALHPASRRRNYCRFPAGERMPERDLHPPVHVRLQAHECGDLSPLCPPSSVVITACATPAK